MRKSIICWSKWLLLAGMVLVQSCAKEIVDLTGDIKGTVKDADDGHFIENCLVGLSPGGVSKTTNENGMFEFPGLAPGEYTLSFSKVGYPDVSKSVTVVVGEETNADILMKANAPFAISHEVLDFGDLKTNKSFSVLNNSDSEYSFTISNIPEWLSLSRTNGTVKGASQTVINTTLDRDGVEYGSYAQNIIIAYSGRTSGEVLLMIKFDKVELSVPEVTIASEAENVSETSFDIKGNIVATGGTQIINHGHCWSTDQQPTIDDDKTELGARKETGSFISTITGLTTYTTYYMRAYAVNAQGVSYSEQVTVTTEDAYSDNWDGNMASSFAGGKGTKANPYIIETGGQLLLMQNHGDSYFRLANNINLNHHNWLPFGFSGELDGNGYVITNLKVEREVDHAGLFSQLTGRVKNLTISNVSIEGNTIGAVAGWLYWDGLVTNCTVVLKSESKLEGNTVGGIVGKIGISYNDGRQPSIIECKIVSEDNSVYISGEGSVGGIAGHGVEEIEISDCMVNCNVIGNSGVGGILGTSENWAPQIKNCEYNGSIYGVEHIGGILGFAENDAYITACKTVANIDVEEGWAGGIWGADGIYGDIDVIACYSAGSLSSDNPSAYCVGGIAGGAYRDKISQSGSASLSYSTMTSSLKNFDGMGKTRCSECAYVTDHTDITTYFKELYSTHSSYWNFDNEWIWTGTINGQEKQIRCPRLAWE